MESGEYFLNEEQRNSKKKMEKKMSEMKKTEERHAKRAAELTPNEVNQEATALKKRKLNQDSENKDASSVTSLAKKLKKKTKLAASKDKFSSAKGSSGGALL